MSAIAKGVVIVVVFLIGGLFWAGIGVVTGTVRLGSAKEEPQPTSTPVVVTSVAVATSTPGVGGPSSTVEPVSAAPLGAVGSPSTPTALGAAQPTSTPVVVTVAINPVVSAAGTPLPINPDAVLWATSTTASGSSGIGTTTGSASTATGVGAGSAGVAAGGSGSSPGLVAVAATPRPEASQRAGAAAPSAAQTSSAQASADVSTGGRDPWVLLPQPEPGARVAAGRLTVEARGRGDAPIAQIQLTINGTGLPVTLEQRSDVTWRGLTTTTVAPGRHTVTAVVIDTVGRTGSYRWSFEATP